MIQISLSDLRVVSLVQSLPRPMIVLSVDIEQLLHQELLIRVLSLFVPMQFKAFRYGVQRPQIGHLIFILNDNIAGHVHIHVPPT